MTTIEFKGKTYTLTTDADFTGGLLGVGYTDYHDAKGDGSYDFEMSAQATDKEGIEHTVYWIFECTDQGQELDSYDYDNVYRIEEN